MTAIDDAISQLEERRRQITAEICDLDAVLDSLRGMAVPPPTVSEEARVLDDARSMHHADDGCFPPQATTPMARNEPEKSINETKLVPGLPTDPAFKAEVIHHAELHGTMSAVLKYGVSQNTIDKWRRAAKPKEEKRKLHAESRATGEKAILHQHDRFVPGEAAKQRLREYGPPPLEGSLEQRLRELNRLNAKQG